MPSLLRDFTVQNNNELVNLISTKINFPYQTTIFYLLKQVVLSKLQENPRYKVKISETRTLQLNECRTNDKICVSQLARKLKKAPYVRAA